MSASVAILPRPPASPALADPCEAERRALAATITALSAAVTDLQAVQEPISRLPGAIQVAEAAEAKLADCRRPDDERLSVWLVAGAAGLRPRPCEETIVAAVDVAI